MGVAEQAYRKRDAQGEHGPAGWFATEHAARPEGI